MELATPLAIAFAASFSLIAVLTLTSFIKVSVVLLIVRNAIGLPQVPSNLIITMLAMFIAVFISMPVFSEALSVVAEIEGPIETIPDFIALGQRALAPFRAFLLQNVSPEHVQMFVEVADRVWESSGMTAASNDLIVQIPAFLITELNEAFQIGFLLYLPFIAVDLAVTAVLMALGMQMVQPNIISTPFKLLLFVFVDGWSRLAEGLIINYSGL